MRDGNGGFARLLALGLGGSLLAIAHPASGQQPNTTASAMTQSAAVGAEDRMASASDSVDPETGKRTARFLNGLFNGHLADWNRTCSTAPDPGFQGYSARQGSPAAPNAAAQTGLGLLRGVIRTSGGQPAPETRVIVESLDEQRMRAVLSGGDGSFIIKNLKAGRYRVSAGEDGFGRSAEIVVTVAAGGSVNVDLDLAGVALAEHQAGDGPSSGAAQDGPQPTPTEEGVLILLADQTQAPAAEQTAAPASSAKPEPFAFADFSWLNGTPRQKKAAFDSPVFTLDMRVDTNLTHSFNHPNDHTITGSAELARSDEFQVQQLGIGGDFHYDNVRARLMTQFGLFSALTPRNDASTNRGQWLNQGTLYKDLAEAYGGYHIDKMNGINVDFGIFMSYVGLFSYYNYDNWAYQPSYVSANTPWFFQGMRIQLFPTDKFKQEIWLINGWQSYGTYFSEPGIGGQTLWRPNGSMSFLSNNYYGKDSVGNPNRRRVHTDNSATLKFYENMEGPISKNALSFTFDFGCEWGDGVVCTGGQPSTNDFGAASAGAGCQPCSQYFLGWMVYDRTWFDRDEFAVTVGGGWMDNPGRYLAIVPVVNGATAVTGSPYFTENPGDHLKAWDWGVTVDYMPKDSITFRWETGYRHTNVPYWSGSGGVTPPGGNTGTPGIAVPGWIPDLVKNEYRLIFAMLVKI